MRDIFAQGRTIPVSNPTYPMANLNGSSYAAPLMYNRPTETLGGYDAQINPMTGQEVPQTNFAHGGLASLTQPSDDFARAMQSGIAAYAGGGTVRHFQVGGDTATLPEQVVRGYRLPPLPQPGSAAFMSRWGPNAMESDDGGSNPGDQAYWESMRQQSYYGEAPDPQAAANSTINTTYQTAVNQLAKETGRTTNAVEELARTDKSLAQRLLDRVENALRATPRAATEAAGGIGALALATAVSPAMAPILAMTGFAGKAGDWFADKVLGKGADGDKAQTGYTIPQDIRDSLNRANSAHRDVIQASLLPTLGTDRNPSEYGAATSPFTGKPVNVPNAPNIFGSGSGTAGASTYDSRTVPPADYTLEGGPTVTGYRNIPAPPSSGGITTSPSTQGDGSPPFTTLPAPPSTVSTGPVAGGGGGAAAPAPATGGFNIPVPEGGVFRSAFDPMYSAATSAQYGLGGARNLQDYLANLQQSLRPGPITPYRFQTASERPATPTAPVAPQGIAGVAPSVRDQQLPYEEDLYAGPKMKLAGGGLADLDDTYKAGGKLLRGPGDGMSDSIPAVIHGEKTQRAALADGEFVIPADVVSHLGNGSTDAGSRKLYEMMDRVRKARTGRTRQAPAINPDRYMPNA